MTESIITSELVHLDVNTGTNNADVIRYLANSLLAAGRIRATDSIIAAALAREQQSPTGLPGGLAIPHCRVDDVHTASLGFVRLDPRVDFGAPDGPADLVFLIAAPADGGPEHMRLLSSLARALVRPDFVSALRSATTADAVVALVNEAVSPRPPAAAARPDTTTAPTSTSTSAITETAEKPDTPPAVRRHLVAVTACPTGIAHTYMAADALQLAAERAGAQITVETQGSGANTSLEPGVIAAADAVIFATDVGVKDRNRFAGKPVVAGSTNRAINNPDAVIADALAAADDPHATRVANSESASRQQLTSTGVGVGSQLKQALLTGVSYMIPFVAAGGLLIALGFLLAGYKIGSTPTGATDPMGWTIALNSSFWHLPADGLMQYLGAVSFTIGKMAFFFLVPALAGYIAYAIADRPGIAPGFTAGYIAATVGAGFIGGLVGGLLAGVVALYIGRIPLPQWARGLMPVVVIPLCATLITGAVMFFFLGRPLAWITTELTNWLGSLDGSSRITLGIILGLMMCFDLGGPVNKAAYAFAAQGVAAGTASDLRIMAAVMVAGMVPPLAMALATVLRPKLFTEPERENGKAAWLLGLSFISEGAIPFAAADPFRVIPSMMAGGAVSGALVMVLDVQLRAPHGGIFVFFAMNNALLFVLALIAGVLVAAITVLSLKQVRVRTTPSGQQITATPVAA